MLSGQAAASAIEGDTVVLDLGPFDLGPFIDTANQQLIDSGFTAAARIPQVHPAVELFAASTLRHAQFAYRMLDAVATWQPLFIPLILAGDRYRRRAVLGIGLGGAAGMLALAAALTAGRGVGLALLLAVIEFLDQALRATGADRDHHGRNPGIAPVVGRQLAAGRSHDPLGCSSLS